MPSVTLPLILVIFGSGALAGSVGSMLGLGGGVFLVPLLNLALGFPLRTAAAISLCTVIATSSSVSSGRAGTQLINLRLGMVLEVATVAGSLLGGLTATLFSEAALQRLFGVVATLTLLRCSPESVAVTSSSIRQSSPGRSAAGFSTTRAGRWSPTG